MTKILCLITHALLLLCFKRIFRLVSFFMFTFGRLLLILSTDMRQPFNLLVELKCWTHFYKKKDIWHKTVVGSYPPPKLSVCIFVRSNFIFPFPECIWNGGINNSWRKSFLFKKFNCFLLSLPKILISLRWWLRGAEKFGTRHTFAKCR